MYQYTYLVGSLISFFVWLLFYSTRSDLRKEMLQLSLVTTVLGLSDILYFGIYWTPAFVFNFGNYGLESLILAFSYGGICGVAYEYFLRRTPLKLTRISFQLGYRQVVTSILIGVVIFLSLEFFTVINPIYTSTIALFVISAAFIFLRNDLFLTSLISGVISVIISLIIYWGLLILYPGFIDIFWNYSTISGIKVFEIPIEEYFFHFFVGTCLGVMYEVRYGMKDVKPTLWNKLISKFYTKFST